MALDVMAVRAEAERQIAEEKALIEKIVKEIEVEIDRNLLIFARLKEIEIQLLRLLSTEKLLHEQIIERLIALYSAPEKGWTVKMLERGTNLYLVFSGHLDKTDETLSDTQS